MTQTDREWTDLPSDICMHIWSYVGNRTHKTAQMLKYDPIAKELLGSMVYTHVRDPEIVGLCREMFFTLCRLQREFDLHEIYITDLSEFMSDEIVNRAIAGYGYDRCKLWTAEFLSSFYNAWDNGRLLRF